MSVKSVVPSVVIHVVIPIVHGVVVSGTIVHVPGLRIGFGRFLVPVLFAHGSHHWVPIVPTVPTVLVKTAVLIVTARLVVPLVPVGSVELPELVVPVWVPIVPTVGITHPISVVVVTHPVTHWVILG